MMNLSRRNGSLVFLLASLFLNTASGCGRIAADATYTLAGGKTVPGTLLLFSNNVILEKGSSVEGSVVMLCCNLAIHGKVGGSVYLVSGNVRVDGNADVDGNIHVISGNVAR